QVPIAMAEALRGGKLGVMDYMNLKNIEADTQMRGSIGNQESNQPDKEDK
ncbi:flotillin-like FloA family protein, partial [Paenibacillus sepulcri]|nr:flotillin-like FloA family protein [Paenibacillus sepulcri]